MMAQDKASCFPAYLLLHDYAQNGTPEPVVIDATSAPGNKTSYASATLKRLGVGQVYAFERNETRFKTLKQMLYKADCRSESTTGLMMARTKLINYFRCASYAC